MENIFVEFLPPWVETGLQPAFYDKESGTVLQQTARMYARVNMLIRMFNKLSKNTKETVEDYINQFNELHDYVHDYFDNLDVQEEINNKLDAMVEDGSFQEIVGDYLIHKLDYNLVDNTITDAELQNLLNNERSKVIEFEDGTYNFTSTFRVNSNTTLIFNNAVINTTQIHLLFNFKDTDTTITGYDGSHNIKIIGGKFNSAFSFIHGKNIEIISPYFYHIRNDHMMEICACQNVVVNGGKFEGVKAQQESRNYVENIQIENATFTNFPWLAEGSATFDGLGCDNVTIKNCSFEQTDVDTHRLYAGIGGHTFVADHPHTNIKLQNNTFTDPTTYGIRLLNVDRVIIENNILECSIFGYTNTDTTAIEISKLGNNITIKNNEFDGFNRSHIYLDTTSSKNVVISENTFRNINDTMINGTSESISIRLLRTNGCNIDNNVFINNKGGLIFNPNDPSESPSYCVINGNTITMDDTLTPFYYPIRTYSIGDLVFSNNTIRQKNQTGPIIRLGARVTHISAHGNKCNDAQNTISANGYTGGYDDVYGIYFRGYTGNESDTFTNQTLSYDYTQFNTMLITIGTTGDTRVLRAKPWEIIGKLDARTFEFPITTRTSTVVPFTVTLNADGTMTTSEAPANIRLVYFINE